MAQVSEHPLATLLQIWMMTDQMKREQADKIADDIYKKTALEWKKKEFEADQQERERQYKMDLEKMGLAQKGEERHQRDQQIAQGKELFEAGQEKGKEKRRSFEKSRESGVKWLQAMQEAGYSAEEIQKQGETIRGGISKVKPPAIPLPGMEAISQLLGAMPGMEPVGRALMGAPTSGQPPDREATLEDVYGQVSPEFQRKEERDEDLREEQNYICRCR